VTKTESECASYEFTTLTCSKVSPVPLRNRQLEVWKTFDSNKDVFLILVPGVIEYKGANIQLLDLPGIIEGAAQGKGKRDTYNKSYSLLLGFNLTSYSTAWLF